MVEGCWGRKSGVADKKVGIMLITRCGQYMFGGCKSWKAE